MTTSRILPLALLLVAGLAACRQEPAADTAAPVADTPAAQGDPAAPAAGGDGGQEQAFDITRFPVSEVPLGTFPYIQLPRGYHADARSVRSMDFARFPFWANGQAVWVEGRFHGNELRPDEGKSMSEHEVRSNFDALVRQMGGVKLSEGRIPQETIEGWGDEITQGFNGAIGDIWSEPAHTWVVRRNDGNIWIHLVTNTAQGWYLVGQEKGFVQTATLLPASELKSQIDASGKVALQVNFATDRTDILPGSMSQIEQVVQLLREDPSLQLAVNGHTDDTGEAAHNLRLSEGRARSVVDALVAQGIDRARLTSAGLGDSQPVAGNDSDEGKARNRRVELVRR